MVLTKEQTEFFTNRLIAWYQSRYGEEWRQHFHKNMRPSPVNEWVATYGVSKKDLSDLRFNLVMRFTMEDTIRTVGTR